jgi:hypothetical protein
VRTLADAILLIALTRRRWPCQHPQQEETTRCAAHLIWF